ncbi:PRTRC system protein C [Mucilaginibacter robiniae]|uniref:PRTRC system protein C n=1 Tax=Mucilaginibacter robiniae TaxID=2728022 RepID=A0A7L5E6L9_9SPHI|nr:PRTRC system protein C [Mucilaginibacter robiniae]QJD96026.1 PRTRC system protein C [Mucilaginibacter robiniae]
MLDVRKLPRVFIHTENGQKIRLDDPSEELSPEAVCNHFSSLYAILTTAKIVGPEIRDDVQEFEFVSTIGTKG